MQLGRLLGRQVLKRAARGRIQNPNKVQALIRLPTLLRLGYALIRDPRVPLWQRAVVISLLGLIFSPVDVVSTIPAVGQFWDFTLAVVVLDAFIQWAPADVVNEHIYALRLEKKIRPRQL